MKFSSPGVSARFAWTKVRGPGAKDIVMKAHWWCNHNGTEARFYHHYASDSWWFEKEQDATIFLLHWAG